MSEEKQNPGPGETPAPEGAAPGKPETEPTESVEGPDDADQAALEAAKHTLDETRRVADEGTGTASGQPSAFSYDELEAVAEAAGQSGDVELLHDVNLNVSIELGRTRMFVEDVLKLGEGSVVELDKLAGDPVEIYVNDRHVARGEVLVMNDNFCVRISEILSISPNSEPAQ